MSDVLHNNNDNNNPLIHWTTLRPIQLINGEERRKKNSS